VPLARSPGAYLHEILDSRARFHNRVFIRYHQLQLLGEQKEITEVMSRKLGIAQPLSPQRRLRDRLRTIRIPVHIKPDVTEHSSMLFFAAQ
jgi:hypothetical protein